MKINIVYPEKFKTFFDQISRSMQDILQSAHNVDISHNIEDPADVVIVHGSLFYGTFKKRKDTKYILVQMEQFQNQYASSSWQEEKWLSTKALLPWYDMVWDTFYTEHKFLYNIPACQFNLGYHRFFDHHEILSKQHDVSFFGSVNERRRNILYQIPKIKIVGNVTGQRRDNLINSSKINLNIHYAESPLLETLRVIMFLMCNKAFVMTEKSIGGDMLVDREHLVVVSKEDIADKVNYFLSDKNLRERIANQGYNFIKSHYTLKTHIEYCMNRLEM